MLNQKVMCAVYGSKRYPEMYLYALKDKRVDSLPSELLQRFGPPRKIMEILLTPEKPLARVDASHVLESIAVRGFYLQMPPAEKENWFAEYVANASQQRNEALSDESW